MGTNYFLIRKQDNAVANKLWGARNVVINNTNFVTLLEPIIKELFKEPIRIANENNFDIVQNRFDDGLHETIQRLASYIQYDLSYVFDIRDHRGVHIGKSSAGWLFNFQDQDIVQDDVHIKWHSYEDVMSFLKEWVDEKKIFTIIDEYDREISYPEFKDFVDTKQSDPHNLENPDNFTYSRNVNGYRFSEGDFS